VVRSNIEHSHRNERKHRQSSHRWYLSHQDERSRYNHEYYVAHKEAGVAGDGKMLEEGLVCDLFEAALSRDGSTSVAKIARELAEKGYLSRRTKRAYSRQNVWLVLRKSARGRDLLARNAHDQPRSADSWERR
jgi:hypothetical protein